jgi:ubiquinone/menaquinone biosynthesis C-methylase UbiE
LFEKLVGSPPRKILDAGCGTGKHSIYFAGQGYDVYGIDKSSGMLREAVKNSVGLQINFAMGDIRSLSFPNDFFDGMWTVAAIAHLPPADKRKFIQEAHRVLKPNGILYVGTHNLFSAKHLTRLAKFYLSHLARSNDHLIVKVKTVVAWAKTGYLFLDNRHWFYPWKGSLLKMLREIGFIILENNSCFSKRLSVYARKVVADPKGGS